MPGPETILWRDQVRPNLSSFGVMRRVENLIGIGDSDVVYCLRWFKEPAVVGWLELKRLRHWPVRAATVIRLPHFSVDQVDFLETWGRAGSGAYLLAQVERHFLLWKWDALRDLQRGLRRNEFVGTSLVYELGKFPTAKVLRELTK